ncbi:pancreatic lipase-related protein 2-like [Schistocerca serialis cubense]|uniref:pancreatic lipase-related protein 2-like n=1 Tax=Schistocerca serialis cubense TaxID=2023355 RepID=UPI00214E3FE9|nr:pancreatic lipase-related protein 2-like [Schistocerca serialis cubense]
MLNQIHNFEDTCQLLYPLRYGKCVAGTNAGGSDFSFALYTRSALKPDALVNLKNAENLLHLKEYNTSRPTVFYFFGYIEDLSSDNVKTVIDALDPAYPLLYILENTHIKETSADFVDVIHTGGGKYGVPMNTGSVDFYPNGGERIQPGCPKRSQGLLTPSV